MDNRPPDTYISVVAGLWIRHVELLIVRPRTPDRRDGPQAATDGQLYSDGRCDQCTSLISMSYPCGIVSPIPCNPSLFFKTSVGRLAL